MNTPSKMAMEAAKSIEDTFYPEENYPTQEEMAQIIDEKMGVKDKHEECAPYWLCYGMALYLKEIGEGCERQATGGEECHNTSDCITEWCAPCAGKAWLSQQKSHSTKGDNEE